MEGRKSLLTEHQNQGEMLYSEIEEEADCQPHAEKEETMGSAKTEKKINIVRKGLDWKSRNHVEINIKEIAGRSPGDSTCKRTAKGTFKPAGIPAVRADAGDRDRSGR